MRTLAVLASLATLALQGPGGTVPVTAPSPSPVSGTTAQADSADYFARPLPAWQPHCLGFGSPWRLCNGTILRECPSGAIWRHTGVDIRTGIQPVMAAGDGVIVGYIVDPTFRGGILIRHDTSFGVVLTQYWHVWPLPGFRVGTRVTRGEKFAVVADMGAQTHLHFAVFEGGYEANAWRGALPPTSCDGFPAWPYRFIDPNAFLALHQPPAAQPAAVVHSRRCRAALDESL